MYDFFLYFLIPYLSSIDQNKKKIPYCHGNRKHIFWLLVSYRAAKKVKYDFLSSV
jgi:hypothetical protein